MVLKSRFAIARTRVHPVEDDIVAVVRDPRRRPRTRRRRRRPSVSAEARATHHARGKGALTNTTALARRRPGGGLTPRPTGGACYRDLCFYHRCAAAAAAAATRYGSLRDRSDHPAGCEPTPPTTLNV